MLPEYNMTVSEALREASLFLDSNNKDGRLARNYWMLTFDWSLTDLVFHLKDQVKRAEWEYFQQILNRIILDEPIQYILGWAEFMDERFIVNQNTLIPREETSGLVELTNELIEKHKSYRILDIGTGSGIIAIMLAKRIDNIEVTATDISLKALEVAIQNAENHSVRIEFIQSDLMTDIPPQTYDIIVSNPPYIGKHELSLMDVHVRKFEPETALFAADMGLDIYKRLAEQLPEYLAESGSIILEIGFKQGREVKEIFQKVFPRAQIDILKDFNDKDRYIRINL